MNKKVLLTCLIVILLVATCTIGFFLGRDYANKEAENTTKVEEKNEEKNEEEQPEEPKPETIFFDKIKANNELNTFMMAFPTTGMNDDDTIIASNRRNNVELLDAKTKLRLAWYYVFKSGSTDKLKYDASPSGEEVSGSAGVDFSYFKEFYQSMFDEALPTNPDYTVLGYSTDYLKDNIIYGTMASGLPTIYTAFKAASITKTNDNYELIIDVIHEDNPEDDENAIINQYLENDKNDYPTNLVIYHLKVTYKIVNNKYILKSLVAY